MKWPALFVLTSLIVFPAASAENWPVQNLSDAAVAAAEQKRAEYQNSNLVSVETQDYSSNGDYLGWGEKGTLKETPGEIPLSEGGIKFDEEGLPLVKRRHLEGLFFNPITLAQFALVAHGQYVRGGGPELFLKAASRLAERQELDGSFRYHFHFRHYTMEKPYQDGWISGMAQGHALSVFARAYLITKDEKYKEAGDKALKFLLTKQEDGGPATTLADLDPTLPHYIFFEEYVTEPDVYTLNGYVFTLLGLYDWWEVTQSNLALENFNNGIASLVKMLPLYNIAGFSSYDLSYLTIRDRPEIATPHMSADYHKLHIQLLFALHTITGKTVFKEMANRWLSFVED